MKNWSRILLLGSALVLAGLARVDAWPPETGTCYVTCEGGYYPVSSASQQECCTQAHVCPDKSAPYTTTWEPDEGWPYLCPPYYS